MPIEQLAPLTSNGQQSQIMAALGMKSSIAGNILGGFNSFMQFKDIKNSNLNPAQKKMGQADAAFDTISSAAAFIPGVGPAVSAGLQIANQLGGAFVKTPSGMKDYQENQEVTGNAAFGGVTNNSNQSKATIDTFGSSGLVGKLFGKKDSMGQVRDAQAEQKIAAGVVDQNKKAQMNMGSADMFNTRTAMNQSGYNFANMRMGKDGMILKKEAAKLFKKFKKGGAITKNVILEGPLHARKHKIKDIKAFKEAEITHKGIPVITKSQGGDITQHAEVEGSELVLHYDLTQQLEKLMEDNTEESMIAAGKLLARELIKNTKDNKKKLLKS